MSYILMNKTKPLDTLWVTRTQDGALRVVSMSLREAARVVGFSGADVEIFHEDGEAIIDLALVTDDIGDVKSVIADDVFDTGNEVDFGALFNDDEEDNFDVVSAADTTVADGAVVNKPGANCANCANCAVTGGRVADSAVAINIDFDDDSDSDSDVLVDVDDSSSPSRG
jgi:hypothetical protein